MGHLHPRSLMAHPGKRHRHASDSRVRAARWRATGAKDRLILTHVRTRGGRDTAGPSRFLYEAGLLSRPARQAACSYEHEMTRYLGYTRSSHEQSVGLTRRKAAPANRPGCQLARVDPQRIYGAAPP